LLKFYQGGVTYSELQNMSMTEITELVKYADKYIKAETNEIKKARLKSR